MERIAEHADMLLWVTDPETIRRRSDRYLKQLAQHGAITAMVLNKSDRLSPEELSAAVRPWSTACVRWAVKSTIIAVTATTGTESPSYAGSRQRGAGETSGRRATCLADVAVAAADLHGALGSRAQPRCRSRRRRHWPTISSKHPASMP
ncbi:MAG: GTPase domain-containing protein [Acidimicrobiales bacterium]